jgi:hypothetical protein
MPRRYTKRKNENSDDKTLEGILGFVMIVVGYFGFIYSTDTSKFWYQFTYYLLPAVAVITLLIGSYVAYLLKSKKKNNERVDNILLKVSENGFDNTVVNFIDRFGKEGKKESWKYRNFAFDWSRLSDFRDSVIQNGIEISTENFTDLTTILKHYIDNKEKAFLNNGIIAKTQHRFSELNREGSDFEHLIVRLYNALGYASKRIGGSGDQGADVIASRDGVNVLIQAKCYTGPVPNGAVQQAFSALAYHGCNSAVAITTSTFTPGAVALAKANGVELIDGEQLKRKLLENLKEVWL